MTLAETINYMLNGIGNLVMFAIICGIILSVDDKR